jgi:hypothetical protein
MGSYGNAVITLWEHTDKLQLCRTITLPPVTVRHFIVVDVYYYYYYYYYYVVSRRRPFPPGTSPEPTVIATPQASCFRLQYLAHNV